MRFSLCLAAAGALAGWTLRADDRPTAGRVLVLENDRTLEGDIERHGNQYRIKRTIGETWIPGEKVVGLFGSFEEAFAVLRKRANLLDPDERLRLARWCQKVHLREQALEEAEHAVRLRPNHAESRRLLNYLQRPTEATAGDATAPKAGSDPVPAAPVELVTESVSLFTTKVQPILMNACASCHATGSGGAFKLTRPLAHATASQKTTQQNLAAVLTQVNLEQPQASPLLAKAIAVHGEATQPPLKGRQVAAFHTLEQWVHLTIAKNPRLRDQTSRTVAILPAAETKPETPPLEPRAPAAWAIEPKPLPKLRPGDPFDPAIFNRQMHPPVKPETPKP
jgi:hypothetical protein